MFVLLLINLNQLWIVTDSPLWIDGTRKNPDEDPGSYNHKIIMAEHKTSREFIFFFETQPWESGERYSKMIKTPDYTTVSSSLAPQSLF